MIATDGRWDPTARGVYWLAGGGPEADEHGPTRFLLATNDLVSVGATPAKTIPVLEAHFDAGHEVFLDSGVFWLTNQHKRAHNTTMDEALALHPTEIDNFDWLLSAYLDVASRYKDRLWGFTELDQGGALVKRETRAMLHAEGIFPIPVYHPFNDGWDYFDELASTHDRIAFGNVVQASQPVRARLLATGTERHRAYPDLYIHWLGLSPGTLSLGFPVDSCDSSSWVAAVRWGSIRPATVVGIPKFSYPPESRYRRGDPESAERARAVMLIEQRGRQDNLDHFHRRVGEATGWTRYPAVPPPLHLPRGLGQ